MDRPVVLCGLGHVGRRILIQLQATGVPVTVVSQCEPSDPALAGVPYIQGDCRHPENLQKAGIATARGVVIVTSDDLVNVATALAVRRLNPDVRIVVRMFNQGLLARLSGAVKNAVALSVSGLTAPLLALTALTGESLAAFRLEDAPYQVVEASVGVGSPLAGKTVAEVAAEYRLLVLAYLPAHRGAETWDTIAGGIRLTLGDRLAVCGTPADLTRLQSSGRGDLLAGVRWAGWIRRQFRTVRQTIAAIDLPVKLATSALILVLLVSAAVFHYALGAETWGDGLYQAVSIIATGGELRADRQDPFAKVFVSVLKIAGAALFAAFTAIFTQYLLRARLGAAFEARKIPDGGHVVVCGMGNLGFRCVQELLRLEAQVVVIEKVNDNPLAATVRGMGVPVIIGDASVREVLRQARVDSARATLATTESEIGNLEIALLAQELNAEQRVVVRLTDPEFARSVREAAEMRLAVSVPDLAAPAFAAALYGDRVQSLFTLAGQTLAIVDVQIQEGDPCLQDRSLVAAMVDYRFLPLALTGMEPFVVTGLPRSARLTAGQQLTLAIRLPDLERLLRREPVPANYQVLVESFPVPARESLLPIVRTTHACTQEQAEMHLDALPCVLARGMTRGDAEELLARISREKVQGRIAPETA